MGSAPRSPPHSSPNRQFSTGGEVLDAPGSFLQLHLFYLRNGGIWFITAIKGFMHVRGENLKRTKHASEPRTRGATGTCELPKTHTWHRGAESSLSATTTPRAGSEFQAPHRHHTWSFRAGKIYSSPEDDQDPHSLSRTAGSPEQGEGPASRTRPEPEMRLHRI